MWKEELEKCVKGKEFLKLEEGKNNLVLIFF